MASDIKISFEVEPIVKVLCWAKDCKNNLRPLGHLCCNLKNIEIDEKGACKMFEKREIDARTNPED